MANTVKKTTLQETCCDLFRVVNGTPRQNMKKLIELMGGIETLIGQDDIVIIKPNLQWRNQSAPNLLALKTFIDLIIQRSGGFTGEVVIMENVHRGAQPWRSAGTAWAYQFDRNADLDDIKNMSELGDELKNQYGERFSVCHLIDVKDGGKRVYHPSQGAGYVYCDGSNGVPLLDFNNGLKEDKFRSTIMTYPILETDRGTIVDFKNGVWEKDHYTNQPLKFINFAAINHHSKWCGISSAIKNYLGISDLSGGPDPANDGKLTEKYYNFHSFPFDKWAPGPRPGMLGAEVGYFMHTIRKADLNITTAEWVGLVSRTDPPVARTRAILASTDPVVLDYHATKYILYPNSKIWFHRPGTENSPTHQYLKACAEQGVGTFDEHYVQVKSYDLKTNTYQSDDQLPVKGDFDWGGSAKLMLKYFLLRYGLY